MISKQILSIKTGVPQASVLGPFLFLKYTNDLPDVSDKAEITMFADDTLLQSGKGTQCLLSSEMEPVCDWFSSNKLTINPTKCEAVCFGHGKPEKIKMGSAELEHKTSCKYLRVHLDKKLNFHEHIDYVAKKLNEFCGLIYRIHPRKGLLIFYNSFAESIICHGFFALGSAAKTNLQFAN